MTLNLSNVHLLEAAGSGGVYQHALAVAAALVEADAKVTFHTATDPELTIEGVKFCRCVKWYRNVRSRRLRQLLTMLRAFFVTRRHLRSLAASDAVLHVQGSTLMNAPILLLNRNTKWAKFLFSPHNTFDRHGIRAGAWLMRHWARQSYSTFVFSPTDVSVVKSWGASPELVPLVQYAPKTQAGHVTEWRNRLSDAPSSQRLALFAGQIRHDKRPDLFVRAIAQTPGVVGAVVGEDRGALSAARAIAADLGVEVRFIDQYLSVDDFAAAIVASDVVVAPYDQASQSGVIALANTLGVPSVATDVGGLGEIATATSHASPASLSQAITDVLRQDAPDQRRRAVYPVTAYAMAKSTSFT